MPSAASFGSAFGLKRGAKIARDLSIARRSIGHDAIKPNRVYRYPIKLTIATPLGKRRRDAGEDVVRYWFSNEVAGEDKKRLVWTFYGNPYDIWVEKEFKVETDAHSKIILTATGHGIRNFTAPKKPAQSKPTSDSKSARGTITTAAATATMTTATAVAQGSEDAAQASAEGSDAAQASAQGSDAAQASAQGSDAAQASSTKGSDAAQGSDAPTRGSDAPTDTGGLKYVRPVGRRVPTSEAEKEAEKSWLLSQLSQS